MHFKKSLAAFLAVAVMISLTACATPSTTTTPEATPTATEPEVVGAQTYTGTAQGFGGEVSVTITVEDGKITDVAAEGASETPERGGKAIANMPAEILSAGNYDVDGVTGATVTSTAVKQAAKAAMVAAGLITNEIAPVKMKAGTYSSEAYGFALCYKIPVTVTVSETAILDITVDTEESAETPPIIASAVKYLIPRIIDNQSVKVDSVTGATASSNGIKTAVEQCLVEALAAAGTDSSAIQNFYSVPEKTGGSETLDTQVLVIGMGGSGVYAAMRAAENGAKVLVIEKTARYGGTTGLTSEIMAINPKKIEAEYNEGNDFTDAVAMRAAWDAYTEGDEKSELVDYMFDYSGDAIDWLVYDHGFQFDYVPKTGFTSSDVYAVKFQFIPNDIGANKAYIAKYFDGIVQDFTDKGGTYMLETEGYELITDSNGDVVGAKARNVVDGTEYTINADSVILATGGFAGNAEMEEKYLSDEYYELKGAWCNFGQNTNDGKMIQAAIDIGAGTYNIGMPPMVHNAATPSFLSGYDTVTVDGQVGARTGRTLVWSAGDLPMDMAISADSLAVNKHGERFTNETQVAMLNSWIAGPRFYSIWSSNQINTIRDEGFSFTPSGPATVYLGYQGAIPEKTPISNAYDVLEDAINAGIAYKADTLADLAEQLGMDPATLEATVTTYNGYCEAGEDKDFGKDAKYLTAIGEGPYYAIVGAPWCYTTCGGLDINDQFQVLKTDGVTPINGLYSVGTDCMGVLFSEKKCYVTFGGAANGWAMTSGYLCGEKVAEYVKNK